MADFDQFVKNLETTGQAAVTAFTGGLESAITEAQASVEQGALRASTILTQTTVPTGGLRAGGGGLLLLLGLGAAAVFLAAR